MNSDGADCFAYAGNTANNAVQLFKDVAAANPDMKALLGSDAVAEPAFTDPKEGGLPADVAKRVTVLAVGLAPKDYPPAGQHFFDDYEKKFGDKEPGQYAIYGYEAMSLLLDAIKRAGDDGDEREAIVEQIFATRDRDSVIGKYCINEEGDTSQRNYGVYEIVGRDARLQGAARGAGDRMTAWTAHLRPPGLVVNALKGDAHEQRAHRWLEWDGEATPRVAPCSACPSTGRRSSAPAPAQGPDAVRLAMQNYTTFATSTGESIDAAGAADVGDLDVVLTDMAATFSRLRGDRRGAGRRRHGGRRDRRRPLDHVADARRRDRRPAGPADRGDPLRRPPRPAREPLRRRLERRAAAQGARVPRAPRCAGATSCRSGSPSSPTPPSTPPTPTSTACA